MRHCRIQEKTNCPNCKTRQTFEKIWNQIFFLFFLGFFFIGAGFPVYSCLGLGKCITLYIIFFNDFVDNEVRIDRCFCCTNCCGRNGEQGSASTESQQRPRCKTATNAKVYTNASNATNASQFDDQMQQMQKCNKCIKCRPLLGRNNASRQVAEAPLP